MPYSFWSYRQRSTVVVEIISLCETALLEELYDSGETKER